MTIKTLHLKQYIYIFIAILILGGLVLFVNRVHTENKNNPNNRAVFTINGTSYSEKAVNSIIASELKLQPNMRDILSRKVYNYLRREQAAQQLNIVPTASEINQTELAYFGPKLNSQLKSLSWIRLVSYDIALQENLDTNNLSQYNGYSLIFWFGQALETGPAYTVPNFGNKQQIAQDRSYAQNRANYYYGQLKNGKMTPAKVLAAIQKNPKLNFATPDNGFLSQSIHFGLSSTETWETQVALPDIINYISSQSKPGLSSIRTGKIGIVPIPKSPNDYADGYYYIVDLSLAHRIPANTASDFNQTVSSIKSSYNGW